MTFPTDKFERVAIEQINDSRAGDARLFRYRTQGSRDPFWMISMVTPPMEYGEGLGLAAYLDGLLGNYTVFDLPCPIPQRESNTGCTVVNTQLKGVTSMVVNTPNDCLAGDFFQLSTNKKVYRITEDSLGAGSKTIKFTPALIEPLNSAGTAFNYGSNVVFQVSVEDRSGGEISARNGKFIQHDLELIEQL